MTLYGGSHLSFPLQSPLCPASRSMSRFSCYVPLLVLCPVSRSMATSACSSSLWLCPHSHGSQHSPGSCVPGVPSCSSCPPPPSIAVRYVRAYERSRYVLQSVSLPLIRVKVLSHAKALLPPIGCIRSLLLPHIPQRSAPRTPSRSAGRWGGAYSVGGRAQPFPNPQNIE